MLLWTTSLEALKVLEFFYGTYMATEVAYYTYIYAKVDKKYYPRVTSHTRAAMFLGKLVAGTSGQVLIILRVMDYRDLNYITFASKDYKLLSLIYICYYFSLCDFQRRLQPLYGLCSYRKSKIVCTFIGMNILTANFQRRVEIMI